MESEERASGCASGQLLRTLVWSWASKKHRQGKTETSNNSGSAGCFAGARSNNGDQRSADSGFEPQTRESTPQLPSPVVLQNSTRRRLPNADTRLASCSSASSLQFVLATHRPEMPKIVQKMLREKQKEYVRLKMMQKNEQHRTQCEVLDAPNLQSPAGHLFIKLAYCSEVRHVSTTLSVISSLAGLRLLFVTLFQSTFDFLTEEFVSNRPIYIQVPSNDAQQETIVFRLLKHIEEIKDGCTLILCDNAVAQAGLLDSYSVRRLSKSQVSRSTYACTSAADRAAGEKQYSAPFSLDSPLSSDVFVTQCNSPGQSAGYVRVQRMQTKAAQTDPAYKSTSACTYESQITDCTLKRGSEQLSSVFSQLNVLRTELAAVRKLQSSAQSELGERLGAMVNELEEAYRTSCDSPNGALRRERESADGLLWRFRGEQQDALASLSEIENMVRALRNHILAQSASPASNGAAMSANSLHLCSGTTVSNEEAQYYGQQLANVIERFRALLQQFESIDQRLAPIRKQELDLLAKEERFVREEPRILDSALKRCQNLNAIITTLKRIAELQQSHLCEHCRPVQPLASQSCQNTPATMPRFGRQQSGPAASANGASAKGAIGTMKRSDSAKAMHRVALTDLLPLALGASLDLSSNSVDEPEHFSAAGLTNSIISRASAASTASSSNSSTDTVVHAKL